MFHISFLEQVVVKQYETKEHTLKCKISSIIYEL